MAKSMIDKYRKILGADPASMVFVELAKALLDAGEPDEAIVTCQAGLEHHPDSIVGHVLWGRALIDLGRPDEAMDQFDRAMGLDPDNPYAYNLIGEVLLHRRLYRSALPVLRRAVSLQPGDRRVRQWLAQAEKAVSEGPGGGPATTVSPDPTVATASELDNALDGAFPSELPTATGEDEVPTATGFDDLAVDPTVATGALADPAGGDLGSALPAGPSSGTATDPHGGATHPEGGPPAGTAVTAPYADKTFDDAFDAAFGAPSSEAPLDAAFDQVAAASSATGDAFGDATEVAVHGGLGAAPQTGFADADGDATVVVSALAETQEAEDPDDTQVGMTEPAPSVEVASEPEPGPAASDEEEDPLTAAWNEDDGQVMRGMTATFQALEEAGVDLPAGPWDEREPVASVEDGVVPEGDLLDPPTPFTRPPAAPPPLPPEGRREAAAAPEDVVSEVFGLELPPLPGQEARPAADRASEPASPPPDTAKAAELAAEYERELREKMIAKPEARGGRRTKLFVGVGGLGLVAVTAIVAFVWVTITGREEAIRTGLESARNGIARDTFAGYGAALDRLQEVLRRDAENAEALALVAAAEAVVFAELDPDPARRQRAEGILADPSIAERHPDPVLDARWHLADEDGRKAIGEEVLVALEARPESATLQYLAGRHHLDAGDAEKATEHFRKALERQPGHARTVLALAGHFTSLERWDDALTYFDNARSNYPGHGRAEIGAAEARLALGRDLDEALAAILGLEKEHGEVLSDVERQRLHGVAARLQHRTGASDAAAARLQSAMATWPNVATLPRILAEIHLDRFALEDALSVVEQARRVAADDPHLRRLQGRILFAWSRYAEAGEALEAIAEPDRRLWLERAIVAYHAGDMRAARRALDGTRNEEGQMLADAAIYLALVDLAGGEARTARTVLDRAARARGADALVEWAMGRWHLEQGNPRPARHHLGNAVEEDPNRYWAYADLGTVEATDDQHDQALAHLTAALEVNPYFREARLMLGQSHLALGEAEPARDAFRRVLAHHAEDPDAHRGMALALLDLEDVDGAEPHARAAVEHGGRDAGNHHALGRVLLAKAEAAPAIAALVQARRRDPDDADILTDLARAHLARGFAADPRHARRYFEQAVEKDGNHAQAHWGLGRVLLQARDVRNSITHLNRAVVLLRRQGDEVALAGAALDLARAHQAGGGRGGLERARRFALESVNTLDSAEAREGLALIFLDEGRPVLARRHLEQAVELDPKRATAQFELGKILAEAGENEPARQALEKALELEPRGGHVREARRILAGLSD
jgi:cellulose synthase operon protein C